MSSVRCVLAVTEQLPQLKSALIISPLLLSHPVVAVSIFRGDNYSPLTILRCPIPSGSSLLPLKTCHLPPLRVSLCPIGPNSRISFTCNTLLGPDAERMIQCGIGNLHLNILFALPSAGATWEVLSHQVIINRTLQRELVSSANRPLGPLVGNMIKELLLTLPAP